MAMTQNDIDMQDAYDAAEAKAWELKMCGTMTNEEYYALEAAAEAAGEYEEDEEEYDDEEYAAIVSDFGYGQQDDEYMAYWRMAPADRVNARIHAEVIEANADRR